MFKVNLIAVSALAVFAATQVSGATLSGTFTVDVRNFDAGGSSAAASANEANELANSIDDTFLYTGLIDFAVGAPQNATYTIAQWLATGTGTISGLDATVGGYQLSSSFMQDTSLFTFTSNFANSFMTTITHDDGISLFDDGVEILEHQEPALVRTTGPALFTGGEFKLIYAAANGNPSVLNVDVSPVPLPASSLLLVAGLGGLLRMRRKKSK